MPATQLPEESYQEPPPSFRDWSVSTPRHPPLDAHPWARDAHDSKRRHFRAFTPLRAHPRRRRPEGVLPRAAHALPASS